MECFYGVPFILVNGREQCERSSKHLLWCYSDKKELRVWNDMGMRIHDTIFTFGTISLHYFMLQYTSFQVMVKEYAHATEDRKMLLVERQKSISYQLRGTVRIFCPLFFLFIFLTEYILQLNGESRN